MKKIIHSPLKYLAFKSSNDEWRLSINLDELRAKGRISRRLILAFLMISAVFAIRLEVYAQPNIPKESIPSNISTDLKGKIVRLYSQDPQERSYAAFKLGQMGEQAVKAIPFLIGLLGEAEKLKQSTALQLSSPEEEAARALAKIGAPAVEPLIISMRHENERISKNASLALLEMKDPRALGPLTAALKDKNDYVRQNLAWILGNIKDIRAVEPLIACLKDADWHVRRNAAWALGEIGDLRAAKPLLTALRDANRYVRRNATEALIKIKDPLSVEPLITLLKDENKDVRSCAALVLGEIKDSRAIGPLIEVLRDNDREVRNNAVWALHQITGEDFGEDIDLWRQWQENKKY